MGVRTGNPRGRPKGAKNKRTAKRERDAKRAAEAIEAVIPEAFAGDAHAYLMAIYKDPTKDDAVRMDAAKAAIRYELPTFSPVEQRSSRPGDDALTLSERLQVLTSLDAEESARRVIELKKRGDGPRSV
jgi:hypothetical protein